MHLLLISIFVLLTACGSSKTTKSEGQGITPTLIITTMCQRENGRVVRKLEVESQDVRIYAFLGFEECSSD